MLEYLIKNGSERVVQQCKDNMFSIQTLKDFQYVDKDGKDQGYNSKFIKTVNVWSIYTCLGVKSSFLSPYTPSFTLLIGASLSEPHISELLSACLFIHDKNYCSFQTFYNQCYICI